MFIANRFASVALMSATLCVGGIGLLGCAAERGAEIPATAIKQSEGNGMVSFTAPHDGQVWVRDVDNDKLIYSGQIRKGQMLSFDRDGDKMMLDSQLIQNKIPDADHKHVIFFQRSSQMDMVQTDVTEHRETTIQQHE